MSFSEGNRVFSAPAPHFMKSLYSIQKTPSLLPCAISSWRRCCGHSVHSSDQLPFQEKRPHGLRSRSSLGQRRRGTGGGKRGRRMVVRELFFSLSALTQEKTHTVTSLFFEINIFEPCCVLHKPVRRVTLSTVKSTLA